MAGPFALDPARIWLLEAPDSATAAAALETLLADPGVEWAEPNRVRELAALRLDLPVPDDPLLRDGRQWGLRNLGPASPWGGVAGADIRALEAWARSAGSNDVLLAVADTGIDPAHPDLAATLPDGSPRIVHAVNLTGLEPADAIADSFYHGTGVAGVMAARTNDGPHFDSLGMAGVCGGDGRGNFGCRLVPIKISPRHSGYATSYAISAAMLYATAVGARAMNLSYAGDGPSRLERLAMHWAIARGCVVVAAAGNSGYPGGPSVQYPAAYAADGLGIQVGATDRFDQRASWSSYGPDMDLMAPGVDIWTTYMTYPNAVGTSYPGYVAASGTSFAAPFVTGAVGLLAAARPELTDVDFKHVLRESAHDIGDPGVDAKTGWGRLDAAAALEAVGPAIGIWHDEVAGQSFRALGFDTLHDRRGRLRHARPLERPAACGAHRGHHEPGAARLVPRAGARVAARGRHDDRARRLAPAVLRALGRGGGVGPARHRGCRARRARSRCAATSTASPPPTAPDAPRTSTCRCRPRRCASASPCWAAWTGRPRWRCSPPRRATRWPPVTRSPCAGRRPIPTRSRRSRWTWCRAGGRRWRSRAWRRARARRA